MQIRKMQMRWVQLACCAVLGMVIAIPAEEQKAPAAGAVPEWQKNLNEQLKKRFESDKEAREKRSLEHFATQLDTTLDTLIKSKSNKQAEPYFKNAWELMRLFPGVAYKTDEARETLSKKSFQVRVFLNTHKAMHDKLTQLYKDVKQKLGLRSDAVQRWTKLLNIQGTVDQSKGQDGKGTPVDEGDITLASDRAAPPKPPGPAEISKIQRLETLLKRLAYFEKQKNIFSFDSEMKAVFKDYDGFYAHQVLVTKDESYAKKYPEVHKFLQGLNRGLGDLHWYQELADGLLKPQDGDGNNDNKPSLKDWADKVNEWKSKNGGNAGKGGGWGRGGRGGRR